jgi:hypothetical protein
MQFHGAPSVGLRGGGICRRREVFGSRFYLNSPLTIFRAPCSPAYLESWMARVEQSACVIFAVTCNAQNNRFIGYSPSMNVVLLKRLRFAAILAHSQRS